MADGKHGAAAIYGPDGYGVLYEEYAGQGLRYAYSLLTNRNDSEDVVQEAFCRLLPPPAHEDRCDGHSVAAGFAPLFFATVRNLSLDVLRKKSRRRDVSLEASGLVPAARVRPGHADRALGLRQAVETSFATMPSQWADALRLRSDAKLSYAEISHVLDITLDQVRTWIYRGRRHLERDLEQAGLLTRRQS